jgi:type IV secretory pathway TrbL component
MLVVVQMVVPIVVPLTYSCCHGVSALLDRKMIDRGAATGAAGGAAAGHWPAMSAASAQKPLGSRRIRLIQSSWVTDIVEVRVFPRGTVVC